MHPGVIVAGKYRIEHVLGRGGMGVVLAATHVHLGTRVALKFLNEGVTNDTKVVQRFLREARSTASLKSEHVCKVSDYGVEGDVPYIVMELMEGTDLAKVVKQRPLDMATAAEYVVQACMGLAEAHAAGIVHRDLKPGNLFVTMRPNGAPLVKVLDFGVAKAPEGGDFSLTQTSSVVGSPGFMAPEQLRSSRQVDQRSDIWSLGVILYKLTSGRQPFRADALTDLAISIAMDPVPPLPEVSPPFAAVVLRCLEKDPALRYQTVHELMNALAQFAIESRQTEAFMRAEAESAVYQSGQVPAGAFAYGTHTTGSGPRYQQSMQSMQSMQAPMSPVLPYAPQGPQQPYVPAVPEPPTTLQGATSQVDIASPTARPAGRSRLLVIGVSAVVMIAIGVGVGIGVGGSGPEVRASTSTSAGASTSATVVPSTTNVVPAAMTIAPPAPDPVKVETPAPKVEQQIEPKVETPLAPPPPIVVEKKKPAPQVVVVKKTAVAPPAVTPVVVKKQPTQLHDNDDPLTKKKTVTKASGPRDFSTRE